MVTLKNEHLTVQISAFGAEIQSIKDNKTQYEYIWQGDPTHWGRRAPVLFPIIGKLKDNSYEYQGKTYELPQHGFARDMTFTEQIQTDNSVTFNLKSNPETLEKYPFEFSLQITYVLYDNQITVSYEVYNPSRDEPLYYNVGGHPAFNVSLRENFYDEYDFDNVFLDLEPAGKFLQLPLSKEGYIQRQDERFVAVNKERLTHQKFKNDALIYQVQHAIVAKLIDEENQVEISMRMHNMGFLGVWSPPTKIAPFICLEPWAGLADEVGATGELTEKYAIQKANPGEIQTHDYSMRFNHI